MNEPAQWQGALAAALGGRLSRLLPVSGGDINQAYCAELEDGRRLFVKHHAHAPRGMFRAEAAGLAWLSAAGALPLPTVLAAGDEFLALGWVEQRPRGAHFDERLGRGLAALHRAGAQGFGADAPNFIGTLPQDNTPQPSWSAFYGRARLLPQLMRARDTGALPDATCTGLERLIAALGGLLSEEPPSRLHGDLWAGNVMSDEAGGPMLCDPAPYGGHREVDLAMMRLFGGVSARVFSAYEEAFPLERGVSERVPLYQLYPLLVHVNLFGGGYAASVAAIVRRYVG